MMKFLRSQSQTVLIVVLVLGVGFLFYGSAGNLLIGSGSGHNSNDYGRIDGDDLSVAQLYDSIRMTKDKFLLNGQARALQQPGAGKQLAEAAWGQMLLQHEADRLHITVSDQQVVDKIKQFPNFQKNGVFDPGLYRDQLKTLQFVLRIPADGSVDAAQATEATFEKIIREQLQSEAAMNALFGGVRGSEHDAAEQYQKFYGPVTISYVTIDPKSVANEVKVTPAEVEAEYKDHPTNPAYRTKEKRKVDYVLFLLTPEQQKLPADQKEKAKDALGQQALDFALAFQPNPSANSSNAPPPPAPDFDAEAKKRGLAAVTTDFFADDAAPSGLPPSPGFNSAAFELTKDNPVSKVVDMDNGVAVIHLDEIQPSQLRPLAEVTPDIEKQLSQTKAAQAAEQRAKAVSDALKAEIAKGTDFKAAAAALKLSVTTVPAFVPSKAPQNDTTLQMLAYSSTSLKPGEISAPIPMESNGGFLVAHLDNRGPADPAGFADFEKRAHDQQAEQLRAVAYTDWVNWMSKQPGTHKPPDLEAYGGVD